MNEREVDSIKIIEHYFGRLFFIAFMARYCRFSADSVLLFLVAAGLVARLFSFELLFLLQLQEI